nr:hypothetical protein GCM10020093_057700 [Planobispora longispora]
MAGQRGAAQQEQQLGDVVEQDAHVDGLAPGVQPGRAGPALGDVLPPAPDPLLEEQAGPVVSGTPFQQLRQCVSGSFPDIAPPGRVLRQPLEK